MSMLIERLCMGALIIILLLSVRVFYVPYIEKKTEIRVVERITKEYDAKYQIKLNQSLESERNMLNAQIELERKKNDDIKTDNDRLTALVGSLQKRATRASRGGNSKSAPSGTTCTGAGLYRDDGEFLARYARDAEKVKKERDYFFDLYKAVKDELIQLKQKQK